MAIKIKAGVIVQISSIKVRPHYMVGLDYILARGLSSSSRIVSKDITTC